MLRASPRSPGRCRVALLVGAASLACLTACSREAPRPALVLVTLDTTRADALGAFGGRPGVTPHLDAFARDSSRYTQARTVAPMTLPAHASMFTGLYPPRHGVRDNGPMFLPDSARTLAEYARDAGYETAAFVSALALDRAFGLEQGFELYDQPEVELSTPVAVCGERRDEETVARAVAWLSERDDSRPLFLWVHFFDPHAPYEPAPRYVAQAGGDAYLGEVASMDAAFGRLLEALRGRDSGERATIAVVGDHGEGLYDHGEPTHALLCYDSTLLVPFLLHDGTGSRPPRESSETVSVADVFPTLVEALGVAPPRGLDGVSLNGPALPRERGVYFETYYGHRAFGWSPLAGWVDEAGKYLHSSSPQFFSLRDDPGEKRDLYGDPAVTTERQRAELARIQSLPALEPDPRRGVSADVLSRLGALGYASTDDPEQVFPSALEASSLPPPRERMAGFLVYNEADEALEHGRPDLAAPLLERVLEENPRNPWALNKLARALMELGEPARALVVLRARLEFPPELVATHQGIADCLRATGGAPTEIREHLRRAMWLMAEAHELRGEAAEAGKYRELLRRALEQEASGPR